ncbi:MAG: MBL fold metallo-hydrolase [Elusimicrobia bacterium]|nr:MBL fold metallo-hydrolase [Elusimicrobiota bacterium]
MSAPRVEFWGTRGSIPSPGPKTLRYGGNTSCVCIRWDDEVLICDAGTGIRPLGFHLANSGAPTSGHVFIGHTHWDHIQGFPFFFPAYLPKNKWAIHSAKGVGDSFEAIFKRQMGINYFPVEVGDMAARLDFTQITGHPFEAGPVKVSTIYTNHPGICVGYRFDMAGKSAVYLTDHETHWTHMGRSEYSERLDREVADFCRGADLLVCDSQYTDDEYEKKRGWGHSRWRDTAALGVSAEVKRLALFHHDPERSDDDIDAFVGDALEFLGKSKSPIEVFAAREGQAVEL